MSQFTENIYLKFPSDQLITFAILSVKRNKDECTFERLVKECFTLFPKSFGFYRYPDWPDSLKLDRPLRDLRLKRFISGSNQTRFDLTTLGEKYAIEIEKRLLGNHQQIKKPAPLGRKEKRLFDNIKASEEFKVFNSGKGKKTITEPALKRLFFGTMETPIVLIGKNVDHLINLASDAGEEELLKFLHYCKELIYGRR